MTIPLVSAVIPEEITRVGLKRPGTVTLKSAVETFAERSRLNEARSELQCLVNVLSGIRPSSCLPANHRTVVPASSVERVEPDCSGEPHLGSLQVPQRRFNEAQIVVAGWVIGKASDRIE